jgi:hypothetical protein
MRDKNLPEGVHTEFDLSMSYENYIQSLVIFLVFTFDLSI